MRASAIFEGVLAPGERLLWSGWKKRIPLEVALFGPVIPLSALAIPFITAFFIGNTRVIPTKDLIKIWGFVAFGVAELAFLLLTNRVDGKTAYAVTDRRLLCAIGPRHSAIRAAALADVLGAWRRATRGGALVEFTLWKEGSRMWTSVESGKRDAWRGRFWRVEDPGLVVEVIRGAIGSPNGPGRGAIALPAKEPMQDPGCGLADMDPSAIFQGALTEGERLLWWGRAKRGFYAEAVHWLLVMGIAALGLALGCMRPPGILQSFVIMMLATVAAAMSATGWYAHHVTGKTAYAVTDRRLLWATGTRREDLTDVALEDMAETRLVQGRGGGSVEFVVHGDGKTYWAPDMWPPQSGNRDAWCGRRWHVEDPELVAGLIGGLIKQSHAAGGGRRSIQTGAISLRGAGERG